MERICKNCGNKFIISQTQINNNRGFFCSRECYYKFIAAKISNCIVCKKEFKIHTHGTKKNDNKFCSRICQKLFTKLKYKKKCAICGKIFYKRAKYCSKKCSDKARDTKVNKICLICGKKFKVYKYKSKKSKFCSNECVGIYNKEIKKGKGNPNFGKSPSLSTRLKMSDKHRGNKSYRWKGGKTKAYFLIRGSMSYLDWRQKCFIRDKFICQDCGDKTGGNLNVHHIKSFKKLMKEAIKYMPLLQPYDAAMVYIPMWNPNNGITVCEKCHRKRHKKWQK